MSVLNRQERNMHTFSLVDAQVLLGLYSVSPSDEISCLTIIKSCDSTSHLIPTFAELTAAVNKFLYVSVIIIDGDKIALTCFGRELVVKANATAKAETQLGELLVLVHKELAGYKLKSMCNRTLWTEDQYQHAVEVYVANNKLCIF